MTLTASTTRLRVLASTPCLTSNSLREIATAFGTETPLSDSLQSTADEGGATLIITNTPAYVLAAYLQTSTNMHTALTQWIEWAENLLRYQRKNRREITLVDLELLARGSTRDFDRLKTRLNTSFSRLPAAITTSPPHNMLLLLANIGINANHRTASLAQELEAAMFCAVDEVGMIDLAEKVLSELRHNSNELSLQRETMALQISEIEKQAGLLAAEKQKSMEVSEALRQESSLASQLREQLDEQSNLKPMLIAAQECVEALSTRKQSHLEEFSRLLAQILHKNDLVRWPWISRRAWQIRIVRDCGIVNPVWYLQQHEDVAKAGAEPFRHYIDYGVREGRPPNANFL